jgi:hypothetical protein
MKPARRLVTIDDARGKSRAIADGPAPEGVIWATDRTPARITAELPRMPGTFEPPPGGSVCRLLAVLPDGASKPAMKKSRTLDFCLVLEGEVTLVLDLEEVPLRAGDVVVQRGTRHAWSNRSARPCRIAISSHDATEAPA